MSKFLGVGMFISEVGLESSLKVNAKRNGSIQWVYLHCMKEGFRPPVVGVFQNARSFCVPLRGRIPKRCFFGIVYADCQAKNNCLVNTLLRFQLMLHIDPNA